MSSDEIIPQVVLIVGKPTTGKSASLRNLEKDRYVYINADLKRLPYRGSKQQFADIIDIEDPYEALDILEEIAGEDDLDGVVIDTLTFLMNMFENQYVAGASNGQQAWADYAKFYKDILHAAKTSGKSVVFLAHAADTVNEDKDKEVRVPIKGSVGKIGCEADFTTILASKCLPIKELEPYEKGNKLLSITDEERELGYKYVFQTRKTKTTTGEPMRSPMFMWESPELYIDNDVQLVFNRLKEFD